MTAAGRQARRLVLALLVVLCGAAVVAGLAVPGTTSPALVEAADTSQFRAGNIISDQLFFDGGAMSADEVQTFLQQKNPNCVTPADGTPCLKNARQDTGDKAADSRCPGAYAGARDESASTIIAKVGAACGISQRVLLVILQKEQGLVTASGSNLYARRYREAMGFACPDTAPCRPEYNGFFNQVYSAARQYKNYATDPGNYNTKVGVVNNIRFDTEVSCGSSPVFVENQATAGLYNYTPYQPNAAALAAGRGTGDGCSAYGNRNFWIYYTDWFGSTQVPGAANVTRRWAELGGNTGVLGASQASVVCGLPAGGCYQAYAKGAIYWSPVSGVHHVLYGPVRDKWGATGWEGGWLGWPSGDPVCGLASGGCFQDFERGSVYWSSATGAHTVSGQVRTEWGTTGWEAGRLGYPVRDQGRLPDGRGEVADFQRGSVYWSQASGAHVVLPGAVRDKWAASGWEGGPLGYPLDDTTCGLAGGGCFQTFEKASVYWSSATGAHTVGGQVRDRWGTTGWESGRLGYPVGDQTTLLDGAGAFVEFQRGSVYSSAATGARIVLPGAVRDRWAAGGWERGPLGMPTGDTTCGLAGDGCLQEFQTASVYWSQATGAYTVSGQVRTEWGTTGWEAGRLGYPVRDQGRLPDGRGEVADFQRGSVYWSPASGAHVVLPGAVRDKWTALGGEAGTLGYPLGDTTCGPAAGGCAQRFQNSSVYWTASTGAHTVPDAVRTGWVAAGGETGSLGWPVADAVDVAGGRGQLVEFQGGRVYASEATGGHAVSGVLLADFDAAGGPGGGLGLPTADAGRTADGTATFQHFEGGSLYRTAAGVTTVPAAVRTVWSRSGWEHGPLGYPSGPATTGTSGVLTQPFAGGTVYVTAAGGHAVSTAFGAAVAAVQGTTPLGLPTSDARSLAAGGSFQTFENGSVYASPATGARAVARELFPAWQALGWENGPLGYPTASTVALSGGGRFVPFTGGSVYWTAGTGAHVVRGAVLDAWARAGWENGALGYPTGEARPLAAGGSFQTFQRGSVYVGSKTGARVVTQELFPAWEALGWENGPLGYPTADTVALSGGGRFAQFTGGSIYWTAGTGAHAVRGMVRDAWGRSGWENGSLGYPTGDARTLAGGGSFQTFQRGSVYVGPKTGARVVVAELFPAWEALGWENGPLGWPTADTVALSGGGRFVQFQGGSVYWTAGTGAHAVRGAVRDAWARTGWERGSLGYPTGDARTTAGGGTVQDFQRGAITVSGAGVVSVQPGS
ncbi:hypothetical protein [Modestobacter muralis]